MSFYTLVKYKYLLSSDKSQRLQNDGAWKPLEGHWAQVSDEDYKFSQPNEALEYLMKNDGEFKAKRYMPDNELFKDCTFELIYHRTETPDYILTIDDLKTAILEGNDSETNTLILDRTGRPQLIQNLPINDLLIIQGYPVRFETWYANSGIVGPDIELSDRFFDLLYLEMLYGWLLHLISLRSIRRDAFMCTKTEAEVISEIKAEYEKI